MQVSVEKTSELSRKMTVHLPEELVQEKMESKLKKAASEASIKGFRPGKVPQNVIKKMYGTQIRSEIMGELIQSSYVEAMEEQDQKPAGPPNIVPNVDFEEGNGFEYVAEYEVYPQISLDNLGEIEVIRKTSVVETSDLDNMIAKLRDQKKQWQASELPASEGDRLILNFSGVCENENFTDGEVESFPVVLGENQMVPGFEDNLLGLKVGDKKSFEVTFPDPYSNEKLSGKPATFDVEVMQIEASSLPELDAAFMKDYGVDDGDMEAFREEIKANMLRELDHVVRANTKNAVMDALFEQIEFNIPKVMVDQEVEHLVNQAKEKASQQKQDINKLDLPTDVFEKQAKKRVALSLIMSEIIISNQIKAEADQVRSTIEEIAQSYEKPQELINYYYSDQKMLTQIQQIVLENQSVEWVLGHVKINEQKEDFNVLMNRT